MSDDTAGLPDPERPSGNLATVGDIRRATARELLATWLSTTLGTALTLVTLCGVILGAALWTVDRAEAKSGEVAKAETESVKHDLAEHKLHEAEHHSWTEKMLLRSDDKLSAVLEQQHARNPWPEPPPAPPPPLLPDGGLR